MTTFIDTSIVLALINPEEPHHYWSVAEFAKWRAAGPAVICNMVYCEASVAFANRSDFDTAIQAFGFDRIEDDDDTLFRAAKAFRDYKDKNRGPKLGVLPDFLIGAAAEVASAPLATNNRKDFTKYFPSVQQINPPIPPT